jgi:hypothetical protein
MTAVEPAKMVEKMDILSAMEAVEDASGKHNSRKKTPPSSAQEEKKRLIRCEPIKCQCDQITKNYTFVIIIFFTNYIVPT